MTPEEIDQASNAELWAQLGSVEGSERAAVLLELGERAADDRDYGQATSLLEEAASVGLASEDQRLARVAQYRLGGALFGAQDLAASAQAYAEAAALCDGPNDGSDRAAALWGRADALRVSGDFAGALEAAIESRAFAEAEAQPSRLAGDACFQQARALYFLDREAEALAACRDARNHMRALGLTSDVAVIDDFALTVCLYLGNLDQAMDLATSCHILAKTSSTTDDDAYAMRRLAEVHIQRGDHDEALDMLEQARARYREDDRTFGIARCDQLRGDVLSELGRFEESLTVLTEARVLFDATGDDRSALKCDMDRAILLHLLHRFDEAARQNRLIIDTCAEADDAMAVNWGRWALVRMADNHLAAGDFERVLEIAQTWPDPTDAPQDAEQAYLALTALRARAYDALGRQDEALEAANEVLRATSMSNLPRDAGHMFEIRAAAHSDEGGPAWEHDLTRAIAVHLAAGDVDRATALSAHFMPGDDAEEQLKLDLVDLDPGRH